MLVLGRKVGEVICIGPDIEVMVTNICEGRLVKLGITAPREVNIARSELLKRNHERSK